MPDPAPEGLLLRLCCCRCGESAPPVGLCRCCCAPRPTRRWKLGSAEEDPPTVPITPLADTAEPRRTPKWPRFWRRKARRPRVARMCAYNKLCLPFLASSFLSSPAAPFQPLAPAAAASVSLRVSSFSFTCPTSFSKASSFGTPFLPSSSSRRQQSTRAGTPTISGATSDRICATSAGLNTRHGAGAKLGGNTLCVPPIWRP